jgi:hypothetical protein
MWLTPYHSRQRARFPSSSHVAMVSHPEDVVTLIQTAAEAALVPG